MREEEDRRPALCGAGRLCQLSAGGEPGEETHAPKGSLCSLVTGWSTSWTSPQGLPGLLSTLPHWRGPASSPDALPLGSRCWSATSAQGPRLPPGTGAAPGGGRKAPSPLGAGSQPGVHNPVGRGWWSLPGRHIRKMEPGIIFLKKTK